MIAENLIIGQGIAGSLLAYELLKRKSSVVIIDDNHQQASSIISAGIINPIIGKRWTLVKDFETLYAKATSLYEEFEKLWGEKFFESKVIIRIFQNKEDQDQWFKNAQISNEHQKIARFNAPGLFSPSIVDPFGSLSVSKAGFCHSERLLTVLRQHFIALGVLKSQEFIYADLKFEADCVSYQGQFYKRVIFCQGFKAQSNPWFDWIPFQNVKGEILKVEINDELLPDVMISQGIWALPLGQRQWMVGSNYDLEKIDCEPTESARQEILNRLQMFVKSPVKVIKHLAGVRPVTADQQPILGMHPEYPSLGILNGFGSKGFLFAPKYSEQFADFLCTKKAIEDSVSLKRYHKNLMAIR